ncbi:hypothetical protein DS66_04355 [Mesotoga sp. SC_3PWM13N19]|nr:hypothetical protein DS66_04355 [Mesotoga sp. SC_3PWM13N19]
MLITVVSKGSFSSTRRHGTVQLENSSDEILPGQEKPSSRTGDPTRRIKAKQTQKTIDSLNSL